MDRARLCEVTALYLAFVLGAVKALLGTAALPFVSWSWTMAALAVAMLASLVAALYFFRAGEPDWSALFALSAAAYASRPLGVESLPVRQLLPCVLLLIALHYPRTLMGRRGQAVTVAAGAALACGLVAMIAPTLLPWDIWTPWVGFIALAVLVLAMRLSWRESRVIWLLVGALPMVVVMVADVVAPGLVPETAAVEASCNLWFVVAPLGGMIEHHQHQQREKLR